MVEAEPLSIDLRDFRRVLGSYPTGVCVITALGADREPLGLVVGSFTSVSLDPPLVGFFPGRTSFTWPKIMATEHFCVNILASDQREVCNRIASRNADKFAGVTYSLSTRDLPVIAGTLARFECRLYSVTEAGDHWFVLGEVLNIELHRDGDPMLFHRGRYGGFAEQLEA